MLLSISELTPNTSSSFLAFKKPPKPPLSKPAEKTIQTILLMANSQTLRCLRFWISLLKSTFAVQNASCLKCIWSSSTISLQENATPVLLPDSWITSTDWLHISWKTLQLSRIWLQAKKKKNNKSPNKAKTTTNTPKKERNRRLK